MIKKLLPILAAVLLLAACNPKYINTSNDFYVERDTEVDPIPATGGAVKLHIYWSDARYLMSCKDDFVTLPDFKYFGKLGTSGEIITEVFFAENRSENKREATLVFTPDEDTGGLSITMKIIQAGYEPIHASVSINPSKTFQKWDGFGAMNLGANWGKAIDWSESETDTFMKDMGLNLMRIRIPYDENAWSGLVAGCKYAVDKYGAHILASPWTMPARMKTPEQLEASKNGITSSLKPECYAEYAAYLQRFVDYMKNAGAPIYAISIQNEPDWTATYEGCIWSAEQHLDFVKNYGDKIDGALLMTGESMGSKHSFYDPVLNDATACENIDIVGGHLYGVSPEPYSLAGQKGKSLWMTEHLLNESWTANTSHWYETLDMLKEIHNCLVNGWNAYIWWYGIRYYSLLGDGEKNTSRGAILPRGNAFAQYSSAIRPGDVRIGCTSEDADGLLACAFKGENGRISVILLNSGNSRFSDLKLDFGQKFPEIKASCCSENGKQNVNVSIDGNIATLDLPGASVTSLVANP